MNVSLNVHTIIKTANNVAASGDTPMPTMPIHLLYGICAVATCLASKYLAGVGITIDTITRVKMVHRPDMTVSSVLKDADHISREFGQNAVVSEALLFVLCTECLQTVEVIEAFGEGSCKNLVNLILREAGIDPLKLTPLGKKTSAKKDFVFVNDDNIDEETVCPFGNAGGAKKSTADEPKSVLPPEILQMGADLTAKARAGKIDTIIGRGEETGRVIEILCRKGTQRCQS